MAGNHRKGENSLQMGSPDKGGGAVLTGPGRPVCAGGDLSLTGVVGVGDG